MTRAERRAMLRKEMSKNGGIKLTNKEKIELYQSTISMGKESHKAFVQKADSINSEIEGAANYKMYEHFLEFYQGDEVKAQEEYKKIIEHRESKN